MQCLSATTKNLTGPLASVCMQGNSLSRLPHPSLSGQSGQQVVTQIIRGQAVSTAISGASPVATVSTQGAASPTPAGQAAGQASPGTSRAQGQGQVKLSLAQLTQLTQVNDETLETWHSHTSHINSKTASKCNVIKADLNDE